MKFDRTTILIGVMALIIAVLAWAVVYYARDELELQAEGEEEAIPTQSTVGSEGGFATVRVTPESQKATGLETAALRSAQGQATVEVYGVVADLQPLFDARGRYLAALSEARALRAIADNSHDEYERVRKLFEDERNVSERAMQAARAQWQSDQARLAATRQSAEGLYDTMRTTWGVTVSEWAADPQSEPFDALASQRQLLVQVTFPFDLQDRAGRTPLMLAPVAAQAGQRAARFVSASPHTDATLPGATYFYLVSGQGLRAGMRVVGRLSLGGTARDGVLMPESAVVWHGGGAWAYVKEDADSFVRRPVETSQEMQGGYFNAAGFAPGEEVVVRGAQLLLSEELKFQIRNENED